LGEAILKSFFDILKISFSKFLIFFSNLEESVFKKLLSTHSSSHRADLNYGFSKIS